MTTTKNLPELKTDSEAEDFVDTADLSEYDFSKFEKVRFEMTTNKDALDSKKLLEDLDYVLDTHGAYNHEEENEFYHLNVYERVKNALQTQAELVDDAAVNDFAQAMKQKLAQKRAEGRGGWQNMTSAELSEMLRHHVTKGDPVDVANFCMMLWNNKQAITKAEQGGER